MSDQPRIELPSTTGDGSTISLVLREEGTLYYLDVRFDVNAYENQGRNDETACVTVRAESVNLWHRRLARCHEGIIKAAAHIKETGVKLKDNLEPCKTCKM